MGSYGNSVPDIQGNSNLTWQVTGPPSKAVIACTCISLEQRANLRSLRCDFRAYMV